MPFGLKNAGATYQRLINRLFKDQIGRNVEAYVDDILVKSLTTSAFLSDVREVFGVLRDSRMKLNPKKCVFGVTSGKFLGYLVSHREIESNPDKVKAIRDMSPPRNFAWTEECQAAFDKLKQYLHRLPTLALPRPEKKLYLYLFAAEEAVSAVLIRDEGTQVPVYYVSRALRGPETRYTQVEKLVLGLVHAARRVKPYFLAHPISVRTDQLIRQILVRPETSGRLTKWAIELGEYDLSYEPRTAIKTQALADFLAELTFTEGREPTSAIAEVSTPHLWTLYVDGSSNGDGSGVGLLLEGPQGEVCSYALRFDFPATNNETEYEALIAGLQLARRLGAQRIHVRSDSQLVVCQVLGEYEAKDETMQRYLSKVHQLTAYFESFEIQRIPRSQNRRADALSRLASTSFSDLNKTILVEVLSEPGYMKEVACPGILPEGQAEARKIQRKSARYALRDGELYKRSYLGPGRDNGRQFAENPFKTWCENLGIKQYFTSVGHPQANGQAENFNRTLLHGLKTRLHRVGSSWVEELPSVLWSYRTTPRSSTQETPFSLTYGAEAVIPAEILTPNPRLATYAAEVNEEERQLDLDLVDERMDIASARVVSYKITLTHYYNARVKHRRFLPGDLVLRKNSVNRAEPQGKLCPKLEGPYRVMESNLSGYCKLSYRDGSLVPRTWYAENLKLYYT
ncbi:uncharacterized protein LOC113765851 [Coffea eugenioides]|uniref:uncharacterized protein LOC113765851 n=1 Tax=Coffea eugenioides TaxID=49369 RepID=UPI000F615DF0|nr:uncharacterized protein LOC113765851 [Coffea eugenioides]